MRAAGAFFISLIIMQISRAVGAANDLHPFAFAGLVTIGVLVWKVRPRWMAAPIWIAAVFVSAFASATVQVFFPNEHLGGALVWWPLLGSLFYRTSPFITSKTTISPATGPTKLGV